MKTNNSADLQIEIMNYILLAYIINQPQYRCLLWSVQVSQVCYNRINRSFHYYQWWGFNKISWVLAEAY